MIDWPFAFVMAVLIIATFSLIGWQQYLRAEVMKEAVRHGATHVKID
jgi:hypothetical protein